MNLLLDAHALLWWLADDPGLSQEARTAIGAAENAVYVSAVTAWEIAIKRALGKLEAPEDLDVAVSASGFQELPITIAHALAAGQLPNHHKDPFDRMLVAQAQLENLILITRDERIVRYALPTIRA
jgi:PIN domain nuclease of toxin-antitoxin system